MNHRDRGIVAALVAVLVGLSVVVALGGSGTQTGVVPGASVPAGSALPSGATPETVVYREGTIGRPSSINPLTARTQADRDLVALVFSGLVALGPDGTYRPDLAEGWTVDSTGSTWTFTLRPDATWQDGVPVTSDDVIFTVNILKSPGYTGPLAASWRGVNATAIDERTVQFDLATPIGGFLQAATVGLLPAHLLSEAPIETLADDPFSLQPVGSGPFVLTSWNAKSATLVPASAANIPAGEPGSSFDPGLEPSPGPSGDTPAQPSDEALSEPVPSAGQAAAESPYPAGSDAPGVGGPTASAFPDATPRPEPALPGIELSFYPDADALAAAYRAGEIDVATGLPPDLAAQVALKPGSRTLSYPRTTLTAIALNLRPGNTELRMPRVRHGLLAAIDRASLITDVFGGAAARADSPIPPSSWAFDKTASRQIRFDPKRAFEDFKAAGWRKLAGGWAAPGTKKPYVMELISPDAETNPTAMAVAEAVAENWRRFGLQTTVIGLPPTEFVEDRLRKGVFQTAAIDVNIGLDPDLYPLFGSTQVSKGGSNISGIQDVALDRDLIKARAPGTLEARRSAFKKLQARLVDKNYLLPIVFRNELVVLDSRVQGPAVRELGDPSDRYWDVLTWRLADGG